MSATSDFRPFSILTQNLANNPRDTQVVIARCLLASFFVLWVSFATPLPNPFWGLLTVSFIGLRTDLGSLWIKAIARLVGTLAGGIAGVFMVIVFSQSPEWTVVSLALWVMLCSIFTTLYQGMAGYGGFLASLTALIVVIANIEHPVVDDVIYYAIYRVSEIVLGLFAITLSAMLIAPQKNHHYLRDQLTRFQQRIDNLVMDAVFPERGDIKGFIKHHEQAGQLSLNIDQQRYYTSKLDWRIRRISGAIERILFEHQSVMAYLVILRRLRVAGHTSDSAPSEYDETAIGKAIEDNAVANVIFDRIRLVRAHLRTLIQALDSHEALAKIPTERAMDKAIRAKSYRDSLYKGAASFLATIIAFAFWAITETPEGPSLMVGSVLLIMLRVVQNKNRLNIKDVVFGALHISALVFVIQFLLMQQLTELWSFFIVYGVGLAYILAGAMSDQSSIFWRIAVLFYSILMPIQNTMQYDAYLFFNQSINVLIGFIIAYMCVELISTPTASKLLEDELGDINQCISRVLDHAESTEEHLFRQQILAYYLDALNMDKLSEREAIIAWFSAINNMCICRIRLTKATLTEKEQALFAQTDHWMRSLTEELVYPGKARSALDQAILARLESLLADCENHINATGRKEALSLVLLVDALRRYYLIIHETNQEQFAESYR